VRRRGASPDKAGRRSAPPAVDISGSFLDALADSDIDAELDAQTALWNSKLDARYQRAQAKAARAQGGSALVGGFFGAGTSALQGYGDWDYQRRVPNGTTKET